MASYFRPIPIFVYEIRNETVLSPNDIQLISNIITNDVDSLINNLFNIMNESKKEVISDQQFLTLKCIDDIKECPICFTDKEQNIELKCSHIFCKPCIKRWLTEKGDTCPICREKAI